MRSGAGLSPRARRANLTWALGCPAFPAHAHSQPECKPTILYGEGCNGLFGFCHLRLCSSEELTRVRCFTGTQETGRKDSQTRDAAPADEGPEVMAVDGDDVNLGGDITPEEMQMMMSMGIPFGFDTTQASFPDASFCCGYQLNDWCQYLLKPHALGFCKVRCNANVHGELP